MSDIRAKFFVAEISRFPGPAETSGGKVRCSPVTRGSVNASFASATPGGTIELTVQNPAALARFDDWRERRREFYVDFTEYTPEAGDGHAFKPTPEGHYNAGRCVECSGTEGEHVGA